MAKISKKQQSKHNKAVRRSVQYYESQGYEVEADVKGQKKPKTINGRRPDLIAKKGIKEVIVEIETLDFLDKDKSQREKFKRYADRSNNRRFWTKKIK